MATYNLSAIDSLLKEVYDPKITNSMRTLFPLLDRFQKWDKKRIGGKHFNVPVYMQEGDSVMSYTESSGLATQQGVPVHEMMQIPLTYLSGVFQITGQALENSKGEKWAIEDALSLAKRDLLIQLHRRQVLDFLGTSSGIRAEIQANAAAGVAAVTIKNPLTFPADRAGYVFKPGDHIVFETAAGVPIEAAVVTNISHGATYDTLNLAANLTVGVTAGDYIYFGVSTTNYEKNMSPNGICDIFDGGAASYMGINLVTYPHFKAYFEGVGGALPLTKQVVTDFLVGTANWAGGNPSVLLCNTELIAEFIDMFDSEIIRTQSREIAGGMTKITWKIFENQVDFFFHDFVPPGLMFALDEKEMYWGVQKEGGFMPKGGDNVLYRLDGQDVFRADWNKYYNLFTRKLNAHGLLFYS